MRSYVIRIGHRDKFNEYTKPYILKTTLDPILLTTAIFVELAIWSIKKSMYVWLESISPYSTLEGLEGIIGEFESD